MAAHTEPATTSCFAASVSLLAPGFRFSVASLLAQPFAVMTSIQRRYCRCDAAKRLSNGQIQGKMAPLLRMDHAYFTVTSKVSFGSGEKDAHQHAQQLWASADAGPLPLRQSGHGRVTVPVTASPVRSRTSTSHGSAVRGFGCDPEARQRL